MKTKAELEKDIINITMKIHREFPELYKYIAEIPENDAGNHSHELGTRRFKEYYNSLEEIVSEYAKTHIKKTDSEPTHFEGYPLYPPSDDIYSKGKKEMNINPEDTSRKKTRMDLENSSNEKSFEDDMSGDDLDVPGSELDDQQESVGSEDEENNYYSLGGDNHNDLDEDKG
ncbi:hypothetical protein [Algoriphagus aquimarinus]|uniref:hypothetical protein n=1 Tax=Algoriphagus aquimarinus TaxID=237018 RepID=UPI0030DBD3F2|tara:strand:- start:523 stop:1038 length:516 start_codon:yes stop_codon:yes gene_type:complete